MRCGIEHCSGNYEPHLHLTCNSCGATFCPDCVKHDLCPNCGGSDYTLKASKAVADYNTVKDCSCGGCSDRFEFDGIGYHCDDCGLVFHLECASEEMTCTSCNGNLTEVTFVRNEGGTDSDLSYVLDVN